LFFFAKIILKMYLLRQFEQSSRVRSAAMQRFYVYIFSKKIIASPVRYVRAASLYYFINPFGKVKIYKKKSMLLP